MAQITRVDYEIAIAKAGSVLAVLDDLSLCQAVWLDMESVQRIDDICDDVKKLIDYFIGEG